MMIHLAPRPLGEKLKVYLSFTHNSKYMINDGTFLFALE
jgi:hypothetical protein